MVSSADLITLFVAWQLLSWLLCLLAHNFAHVPTAESSFRTFIMHRAGDIAFLSGIAIAFHVFGTVQFNELFQLAATNHTTFAFFGTNLQMSAATAITSLIFIGAMSKSAQFPLHMWLPDSLYAPTPIHALLHAGIINAGGFLLNRLAPLYALSPTVLHAVLAVGILTMIFGKCMMLSRNDIKKTLGYSTIGQMGYMMMECGLGAFSLAVFHLIAHGLFKATVFLNCGDVIHKARLEPESPPKPSTDEGPGIVVWTAGVIFSLILPLTIIVGTHHLIGISVLEPQGIFIFALFSWVTAAHGMLTLYRLESKWPTILVMLAGVCVVSVLYFFSAEHFTHFLYPDSAQVEAFFQAAALPIPVYLTLVIALIASIVLSWFMLYLHYHDKIAIRSGRLWSELYLFFINRLYLDTLALRIFEPLKRIGRSIDKSKAALPIVVIAALAFSILEMRPLASTAGATIPLLLLSALALPLFPLHGAYVASISRAPSGIAVLLSLALPVAGILLAPSPPIGLLPAIAILAAFGAIWGSIKALMQNRVQSLLAYTGLALYSILWWNVSQTGIMSAQAKGYGIAVTLAMVGLSLAWDRIRVRYGDLDLNQIGGLFKPMPRFALCTALLVMAALGLPPFGVFFSYLGILLSPGLELSFGLIAVIAAWFAASWYLFKQLIFRLLMGPHRADLRYEDLRPAEIAIFAVIIALLVLPGVLPDKLLEANVLEVTWIGGGA